MDIRDRRGSDEDALSEERRRHRELVHDALRRQIVDVIAEQDIISAGPERIVRIPIRTIREPNFAYGKGPDKDGKGRGQGGFGGGKGQQSPGQGGGNQKGSRGLVGALGGTEPGQEIYEVDVAMSELVDLLYEDLHLPRLEDKDQGTLPKRRATSIEGRKRRGIWPRLNRRASARQHMVRRIASGVRSGKRLPYNEDDLRFSRVRFEEQPSTNAVLFCLMDTSGSMDQQKKFLCRAIFYLVAEHIRRGYPNVEFVFIIHDIAATEVTEDQFFHRGSSGGTALSSAYTKTLEIMRDRYPPDRWNVYVMHCSDGENNSGDNQIMRGTMRKILEQDVRLFAFIEVMGKRFSPEEWRKIVHDWKQQLQGAPASALIGIPLDAPHGIDQDLRALAADFSQLVFVPIDEKQQVADALHLILSHEQKEGGGS